MRCLSYPHQLWLDLKSLFDLFGLKLMCFIIVIEHILKGFTFGGGGAGLVGIPILFLLRSYKDLNSVHIQVLRAVALTPWTIKSVIGVISDTIYIVGYNKFPYITMTLFPSIASCLFIAMLWPLSSVSLTLLLFMIYLHIAVSDLLTEAKYSERIAQYPYKAAHLASFVWIGIFIGQILSTIITGVLISSLEPKDYHYIYLSPIIFLLISVYPTLSNWIGDVIEVRPNNDKVHSSSSSDIHLSNVFHNLFWIKIPRSYSLILPPMNDDKQDECLLCKEVIDDDSKEEIIAKVKSFIDSIDHSISNTDIASQIHNTYFEDNESFKFMTKDIILDHLDGLHDNKTKKKKNETSDDDDERSKMIIPFIGINTEKISQDWRVFLLALCIGVISITMSVLGLLHIDPLFLCIASLISSLLILGAFYLLVDIRIAKIQSFILIQNMFSVSIEAAAFFFFTDTKEQYPEGPHFSNYFYITVMGIVGSICGCIGTWSYYLFMKNWTYKKVFFWNNILFMFVSLLNVVLYKRWNLTIGIPDYLFVLGSETFQVIISIWTYMPATIMISQLCPKGLESTMFAILAGSSNLGNTFAQFQGAYLLKVLSITPNGSPNESAQFNNLWLASLISSLLPCIPLVLIPFLIPNADQTQHLLYSKADYRNEEFYRGPGEDEEDQSHYLYS